MSEPSLYGIHLRYKLIYKRMLVGCFAGGVVIAVLGWLFPSVTAAGESVRGVTTKRRVHLPAHHPVFSQMWVYAVSIAVSFIVSMVLIIMLLYRKHKKFDGGSLPDLSLGVWSWADSGSKDLEPISCCCQKLDFRSLSCWQARL